MKSGENWHDFSHSNLNFLVSEMVSPILRQCLFFVVAFLSVASQHQIPCKYQNTSFSSSRLPIYLGRLCISNFLWALTRIFLQFSHNSCTLNLYFFRNLMTLATAFLFTRTHYGNDCQQHNFLLSTATWNL